MTTNIPTDAQGAEPRGASDGGVAGEGAGAGGRQDWGDIAREYAILAP